MKAIEIASYGAPEVLRVTDRPDPVAGAGELLIRVSASHISRRTLKSTPWAWAMSKNSLTKVTLTA